MTYKTTRKTHFRTSEACARQEETASGQQHIRPTPTKQTRSGFVLVAMLLLISLAVSQPLSASSQQEPLIRHAVESALQQETEQTAALHQWPDYQTSWEIWVPGAASHLPQCPGKLVVTGRDNQLLPVGRLKRQVSCDSGSTSWYINVTIKASLTLPVVVTQTALSRGQALDASMLLLEKRTLDRADEFFTNIRDTIGMEVSRRVRSGDILSPTLVSKPPLVLKGNQVVIIAAKNGINASTKGVALEDGGQGDQIEVQNSTSQKVIHAVVSGLNQVRTQF